MKEICPTCGQRKRRSSEQNRRLHKLFTEMAAQLTAKDGLHHHFLWWKAMCKDRWLGYDEFKLDGKVVYQLRSTSELDVTELNDFMQHVEEYANSRGVYLQD